MSSLKSLVLCLPRSAPISSSQTIAISRCCSKAPLSTTAAQTACLARACAPLRKGSNAVSVPGRHSSSSSSSSSGILAGPSRAIFRLVVPVARATSPMSMSIASQARCLATGSASSSSAAAASSGKAAASSKPDTSSAKSNLDWDSFFKLRLRRRRIQLFFSVTTGLLGGAGGALLLSTGMAEPVVMQIPLDPFVTLGLMTLACAGMGWLIGPSIGNQVFYLVNHRFKAQMMHKESEFFARVRKNRVDPTNSSAGNPVPDFYGEKIQSVSGYRQWLKDQRAFNKKKSRAFV